MRNLLTEDQKKGVSLRYFMQISHAQEMLMEQQAKEQDKLFNRPNVAKRRSPIRSPSDMRMDFQKLVSHVKLSNSDIHKASTGRNSNQDLNKVITQS